MSIGVATVALMLSAGPLFAQTAPPGSFAERVQEATRALVEKGPQLKRFPPQKRQALVEFVFGNVLFVAAHELGHGVLAEFEIPNPGRDEDAADSFAIVTMLNVGNKFSDRVLIEAAKGWYLADRRDKKEGEKPAYYDAHGMNLQRAYQIICLMVGSDPEKYKELADIAKLPEERQASCKGDYTFAAWSWETLLKPKLRAPDQPKQNVELTYGEGKDGMEVYARVFREIRFLETLREYIGERYAWPQPFVMVMETCGEVGANWRSRKLRICYEMAQDFAELYRDYGDALKKSAKQKPKSKPKS